MGAKTAGMGGHGHGPHGGGGMDHKGGAAGKRSRAEMMEKGGPLGKKGAGPMNASAQGLSTAQARKVTRKKTAGGMMGEESMMMMMGQGHPGMGHVGHTHFFSNKDGGKASHGTDRYKTIPTG